MPFETPQNGGFLLAAYVVAAVIYLGYTLSLWVRTRRALREAGQGGREAGTQ
jgi:type VI protein secretion system component VasF